MQRRKFVVGLGSLAAGASVTMGTGALSQSNMDRGIRGEVVNDSDGYLEITAAGGDTGTDYANVDSGDGELTLTFDSVNPDSENWFDDVFEIKNTGQETLDVTVSTDYARLGFYSSTGSHDKSGGDTVTIGSGGTATFGVYINATNWDNSVDLGAKFDEDDAFTISVED